MDLFQLGNEGTHQRGNVGKNGRGGAVQVRQGTVQQTQDQVIGGVPLFQHLQRRLSEDIGYGAGGGIAAGQELGGIPFGEHGCEAALGKEQETGHIIACCG